MKKFAVTVSANICVFAIVMATIGLEIWGDSAPILAIA